MNEIIQQEPPVKILLVDDLNDNLLALEGLLKRNDINIFQAKAGTEALNLMLLHEFALALIDVQMPTMNGFELAEIMRGTKKTKNVPIIFVTANAKSKNFSFKGYESGAVDFLLKPFDVHAIKSKVNIFIELYQHKIELKNQLEMLKKTQIELEQAVKIRDEFMSIASHELKTPLTVLTLHNQLRTQNFRTKNPAPITVEQLSKMFDTDEKQLERINYLITSMLDIARINSGKLPMNSEQFDLCQLVRDIVEQNSELFTAANCLIKMDLCRTAIGNWDHCRIEQVIINLLMNAIRYGAGKPILIQVSNSSLGVQILVSDQGQGIAVENHQRIFQKFERADKSISGLGLGLYIVKQIIDMHQGFIRVESELGQGATFIVELPYTTYNN